MNIYTSEVEYLKDKVKQLEEALAKQEQGEPVAYVNGDALDNMLDDRLAFIQRTKSGYRAIPLYTTPQQRKPLTQEQIDSIPLKNLNKYNTTVAKKYLVRTVEAMHNIKG